MPASLDTDAAVQGLIDFVDASPSPFHATRMTADVLEANGFVAVDETEPFPTEPGRFYVVRGGSLIAWSTQDRPRRPVHSFRIVGAHTDSPNLRIKPNPDHARAGWQLLGVES
jgi:aspartyl aminopeptidase